MITPILRRGGSEPLYEQIYAYIKEEIEGGRLASGERLPSKRKLATHLNISQNTVENAYAQLVAEGYVDSMPKRGYFIGLVEPVSGGISENSRITRTIHKKTGGQNVKFANESGRSAGIGGLVSGFEIFDMKTNTVDAEHFPYATWNRLMRENIKAGGQGLLEQSFPQGNERLRGEIVRYLREYRAIDVHPEQIILGAGMEHLLGLVVDLFPDATFAYENPGYHKVSAVLETRGVKAHPIPVDESGLSAGALRESGADISFITPACHFPLGVTMSFPRRQQILSWVHENPNSYIIEDDYGSEFRFAFKPVPSLHSLDRQDKVIYINTFANTLAPSLRIAYMVLPPKLLETYMRRLSFYSCSVSEFEQQILSAFFSGGYYERHLSRMRKLYRGRRDALVSALSPLGDRLEIRGQESGLHLLLSVRGLLEAELVSRAEAAHVRLYPLSDFYAGGGADGRTVVAGFAGLSSETLMEVGALLSNAWNI
ncbi:MAG: PLP-dependent aminotransferase family protein [Clostridiales Family XIII bacterium]|jgi:GntR family transcriptional regulator/MocR family aminotransferase|nr:PLP-dependent aminotransferase family protein [Clostridiales Family XIII bacterium]